MDSDQVKRSVAEENENFFAYGDNPTIRWRDVELHAKCHAEYETPALEWIRRLLGYLPEQHAYMPSMAMLQTDLENFQSGRNPESEFLKDITFLGRRIRNEDMRRGGWVQHRPYQETDYNRYYHHLSIYKEAARERLCKFLKYEPSLEYSLGAEVFLRQLFEKDTFYNDIAYGDLDYKAATIVKYREAFLTEGQKAADNIPLFAFDGI